MKEARTRPVNRCFGPNCPKPTQTSEQREQKIKDALKEAQAQKALQRAAEKEINCLLEQFHGRYDLVDLLPLVARRCNHATLKVLLERIYRKWSKLPISQQMYVKEFEAEQKAKNAL